MEKKFLQQLLPLPNINDELLEQLIKLENSPDPLARLHSNYYPTIRHEYYADFLRAAEGHNRNSPEHHKAKEMLDGVLKDLRSQYIADLELACELFLVTTNIWSPHRVKIAAE